MMTMYERTNKSIDNLYGSREIEKGENPFTKPCLLCLSAQEVVDKSVFGIAKAGASLARVRTRENYNAGFDIDDVPISFLASRLSTKEEEIKEFVDTYFVPLIERDGHKIDVNSACKAFRNINILTYCDGTLKTLLMEAHLTDRMKELGYTLEEIEEIMRQIVIVPIATDRVLGVEKCSVVAFKDVNDTEVSTEKDAHLLGSQESEEFISYSPTVYQYSYKGDGDHSLKKYSTRDDVMALVTYIIVNALENSVDNYRSHSVIPINISDLFYKMRDLAQMKISREEILQQIDRRLRYGGASKLSKREALALEKLDVVTDQLRTAKRELDRTQHYNLIQAKQLAGLEEAIRNNCSDINTLRILLEGIGWQVSKEQLEMIMNTPSDKEIIEGLESKKTK